MGLTTEVDPTEAVELKATPERSGRLVALEIITQDLIV